MAEQGLSGYRYIPPIDAGGGVDGTRKVCFLRMTHAIVWW